jgi:hypothetical protein
VLTFSRARACSHAARTGAAIMLSAVALGAAASGVKADPAVISGCVGSWTRFTCITRWSEVGDPYIRTVPQPSGDAEQARALERDRKWQDHCRPVITPDRYGVARYQYSAPGCEFGVDTN